MKDTPFIMKGPALLLGWAFDLCMNAEVVKDAED